MEKCNKNKHSFDPCIEIYRFIVYGYIIKKYSKKFARNLEYHLITSSMTKVKCIAIVSLRGCGEFKLEIDIKQKTIKHYGDYQKTRNYPVDKIIDLAISKFQHAIIFK